MQKVLNYQKLDEDVARWVYVFMGRLCFDVNEIDGWQVIPFIKGIAQSGKSTLITKVCRKFYETEDVAVLSNNIEKKFGLSSIVNGFMFISPEVKGDLQLEQAEFQSLVSGEDVRYCPEV
jgi:ABC-type molybdenum transport system ATPase subunit/photorepair protein PhrA